jgi:type 1 fimbria pilin
MKQLVMGLAVSSLFFAAAAQAQAPNPQALVRADSGTVTVQGNAVAAKSSAGANAGDTIVVTGGQATVTYSNGCAVTVTSEYQVAAKAPVCTGVVSGGGDGHLVAAGIGAIALVGVAVGSGGGGGSDNPSSP